MPSLCPCHSQKLYSACCQPLHNGARAESAEALMRSRYAAYSQGLIDYIIKTTHPLHPEMPLEKQRASLSAFSQETTFINLEILDVKEEDTSAFVTFRATLQREGHDISFTEKSTFEKVDGKWLYLKGEMLS